jgi:hypothetical protein
MPCGERTGCDDQLVNHQVQFQQLSDESYQLEEAAIPIDQRNPIIGYSGDNWRFRKVSLHLKSSVESRSHG